jgi:hypothetical protein
MSGAAKRGLMAGIALVAVCVVIGLYVGLYLINVPGSAAAIQGPQGARLYLATVPAAEASDPHPTWVSFYSVNANSGDWRRLTTYVVPANTLVHVTLYEYDSETGLRNPFISQSQGTLGGVFAVNGRTTNAINPNDAAHVFAVPQIGLSVPLPGVSSSAKNACSQAPCSLSMAHETVTFTFRTPSKGLYRWQCFVPCAAGFIDGNGGPMQTEGYMDGYLKVL